MPAKSVTSLAPSSSRHCTHINARKHRCRMLAHGASSFCPYHSRKSESAPPDPEALATDLLRGIRDFSTADSINAFLGNLVRQLARKRIARRDAIAFGYLSQLLLNSLPALDRQLEAENAADASQELADCFSRIKSGSSESSSPPAVAAAPEPRLLSQPAEV